MAINNVTLVGRLTRDPDVNTSSSGVKVCKFTLAVDRSFSLKGEKKTDFINIVVFRAQADVCAKYLKKGSQCGVTGSIQIEMYENQQGKQYYTNIVADRIALLGSKNDGGERQQNEPSGMDGLEQITDDDVPF